MSLSDRVAVMEEGKLSQVGTPLEVYAKPDKMFVAGFIGSPAINLMPASIRENDGGLVIDLGPCQCAIPEQFRETCRPYRDREVVFGIRPEDIRERGFGPEGCPAGNTVDVVVDVVEPLGDRNIVEVNMAGIALTVLTEASADAKPGRGMTVIFDMDKAHIFDRDTQRNILRFQRAG
jgi:multiple sugar transport system ATP-binding protein